MLGFARVTSLGHGNDTTTSEADPMTLPHCQGVENYSRQLAVREAGDAPETLVDYFPEDDWLLVVDESHVSAAQLGAMHGGNLARKIKLVEHGFRLPSALDNRPLTVRSELPNFFHQKFQLLIPSSSLRHNDDDAGLPGSPHRPQPLAPPPPVRPQRDRCSHAEMT